MRLDENKVLTLFTLLTIVPPVKQIELIRLTPKNRREYAALVKDAKLEFLTVSKAVNAAAEKGLTELRRLWVKPKKD